MTPVPAAANDSSKSGASDQASTPITRNRGSSVARSSHPLDGARCGTLAGADLGTLERRSGRAARRQEPVGAEHDLGVRADVDDQGHRLDLVWLLGQDDPGGIGADMAGDARKHVDTGAGMGEDPELGGGRRDRGVGRQREGRRTEGVGSMPSSR